MPLQSFVVRQLTQVGRPDYETVRQGRSGDPAGTISSAAGPVFEIEAQELRLSADEVAERLRARKLHSTDLVFIDGTWMTLAESPPFSEVAEPHARRERRVQAVKGALLLFTVGAIYVGALWFRAFVLH